jgi:predicted nucleic acid-binding protein
MKVQRVYVDTSVIGGCFDEEFAPWSKGLMNDFLNGVFKPVLSEIVAAEIAPAPEAVRMQYAELLALDPQFVELTDEVQKLAASYEERRILPTKFSNDALHIALATIAEVDMLVSWNFKHIVRFDKIRLFNAVNRSYGYKTLEIYSPREVTTYGERDETENG